MSEHEVFLSDYVSNYKPSPLTLDVFRLCWKCPGPMHVVVVGNYVVGYIISVNLFFNNYE